MPTRDELNRFNTQAQALGETAARGDVPTMRVMLAAEPALVGHTQPFSDACKGGQPSAVLELIRAGADVNTTGGSGPARSQKPLLWTLRPLEWTASHRRVLDLLLDHGADPQSALAPALADSALDVLDLVDAKRLDVNVPGDPKLGNTLLREMIRYGKLRSAQWLVLNGADVAAKDKQGWTALHYAGSRGVSPEFAQLLLDQGADPDVPANNGETPLSIARQRQHVKLVSFLEARG